jgi:hypothetical protein
LRHSLPLPNPDHEKKFAGFVAAGGAANHPCRHCATRLGAVAGAASTLFLHGSATNLGAEVGSVGAAGVRRGSPRRYQTSGLTKKFDPRAQDTHLADRTSTAAAITPPPRANYLAQTMPCNYLLAPRNLSPRNSQLPAHNYQTRAYQVAPTNSRIPTRTSHLPTRNSHLPTRAYHFAPTSSYLASKSSRLASITCHLTATTSRLGTRDSVLPKSKP